MIHEGEGQVVKIVCDAPRMSGAVLDGILEITNSAPSMGFNGNPMSDGAYAYYAFPHTMDFNEFAEKAGQVEGVIRAEVVDLSDMPRY